MKCCMVACINILYWENRAADGSAVSCFLRVSDHLESICNFFFTENFDYRNFRDDVIHREIFKIRKSKFLVKKNKSTPNSLKRVKNTKQPRRPVRRRDVDRFSQ